MWDAVPEVSLPGLLAISGGKGKTVIANHLHDHVDHVSVRQQLQQLAGEAVVPYGVVGCCEVDKRSSGLFSWKAILDVLWRQGNLVYSRPPVLKAREQWVNDCFDTSVDESLEDFERDAQQRYRTIALWVSQWFLWLEDRNY